MFTEIRNTIFFYLQSPTVWTIQNKSNVKTTISINEATDVSLVVWISHAFIQLVDSIVNNKWIRGKNTQLSLFFYTNRN